MTNPDRNAIVERWLVYRQQTGHRVRLVDFVKNEVACGELWTEDDLREAGLQQIARVVARALKQHDRLLPTALPDDDNQWEQLALFEKEEAARIVQREYDRCGRYKAGCDRLRAWWEDRWGEPLHVNMPWLDPNWRGESSGGTFIDDPAEEGTA